MYQEGRVSFIEVIESQTEVLEFKKELIELELERALFFVDLGELCGYNFSIIK
jgi:hypothetical protein